MIQQAWVMVARMRSRGRKCELKPLQPTVIPLRSIRSHRLQPERRYGNH
jgi:hypothetical protein